jgi:hypothetical protein
MCSNHNSNTITSSSPPPPPPTPPQHQNEQKHDHSVDNHDNDRTLRHVVLKCIEDALQIVDVHDFDDI